MRKSSNSPLAAISLPSISHRRSGTAHRKSVQHERHEFPWPDPIDQNADAHRHENDQGNIVHMQLKAQEMNWQDVNQINGEAGAGYDVDRRSEEHTSELQSLMRISYAVFCLKTKNTCIK